MSRGPRRIGLCSLLGAALWLAPTGALAATAGASSAVQDGGDSTAGVDRLIAEMRERELVLSRRQRELDQRERSLSELEGLVAERLAKLEAFRSSIEARIESWRAQGGDRVKRLAKVYSAMSPQQVASLIDRLDLDLAVQVIQKMKDKQSAAVLTALPRSRALELSRRMLRPLATDTAGAPARMKR